MPWAPERRQEEKPNRRESGGRGYRGGRRRDSSDLQPPAAAVSQELPLCFGLKNDWVGAVIGPSGSKIKDIQSTTNTKIQIMEGHPKGEVNFFGSKAMQTIAKAERDYFVKI